MHAIAVRNFVLIASCLAAVPALAGVGATSSGVTSSVGQGTNASPEVQQQSAGFVQQNQQLQGAQNPVSANGIVMPGGVANASGAAGARGGANGANGANAANPESNGKPGDPNNAPATPATPPPPPPPPPTYVSVVKHLNPGSDSADPAGMAAVTPASVAAPPAVAPPPVVPAQMKSDTPPPAPAKPATPAAVASVPAAGTAANTGGSERAAETGVISGGRGPAPDGYTFYVGFGIALLLLVIAFGAYLSSQKDEARRSS
jgi:hypothetical protein